MIITLIRFKKDLRSFVSRQEQRDENNYVNYGNSFQERLIAHSFQSYPLNPSNPWSKERTRISRMTRIQFQGYYVVFAFSGKEQAIITKNLFQQYAILCYCWTQLLRILGYCFPKRTKRTKGTKTFLLMETNGRNLHNSLSHARG